MAASQPGSGPDADEYAIYSLLLNQLHATDESYVVINDHTVADAKPFTRTTKRKLQLASTQMRGGLPQQLRADFETKNQNRYQLKS